MARLLLMALVVGSAVCQSQPPASAYHTGHVYEYDYNAQIVSGLPEGSTYYSGLRIVARPRFHFTTPSVVHLQWTNCRLFKLNSQVTEGNPIHEMLPTDVFEEMTGPEFDLMHQELLKPIAFKYIRGHVSDLITQSDDPVWSVNAKRGLLSLMEMNMNERQSLDPLESPHTQNHRATFFKVIEPSVAGECECTYMVNPEMTPDNQPYMTVTKVRNFNRCLEKVSYPVTIFNNLRCDDCHAEHAGGPWTAQSSVSYSLMGSPNQFVIVSAMGESQYSFAPYSEHGGRVATFVNQTLVMLKSWNADHSGSPGPIPSPQSPKEQERPLKADQAIPSAPSSSPVQEEYYKMVQELMLGLAKFTADNINDEARLYFPELQRVLRLLNKATLTKVFEEFGAVTCHNQNLRKIFLDLLPMIGTFPAMEVLIGAIENNQIPPAEAATAIKYLSLVPEPNVMFIKMIADFIKRMTDWPSPDLRKSVYLCLGSFGNKMVTMNYTQIKELNSQLQLVVLLRDQENQQAFRSKLNHRAEDIKMKLQKTKEQYRETREVIVQIFQGLIKSVHNVDRILGLKSVGNAGFEEFYPDIEALVMNNEEHVLVRSQAVTCLRRMLWIMPQKIRNLLLPLFFNRNENDDIRVMAYSYIMMTQPTYPELEMMVKFLYDEPSVNLGSYVWSHLMQTSNYTRACPCVQTMARNATLASRFARPYAWGLQYSNYYMKNFFSDALNMGNKFEMYRVFNNEEAFSSHLSTQYSAEFFGKTSKMFWLGYNMMGSVTPMIEKLLKKKGGMPAVLNELLKPRRQWHSQDHLEEIDSIKQKLKTAPRDYATPEGHFFFFMFDQEIAYYDFNELPFFNDPKSSDSKKDKPEPLDFSHMWNIFKSTFLPLTFNSVPTEAGLPLYMRTSATSMIKINTAMSLQSPPNKERRSSPTLNANFDIQASAVWQLAGYMTVGFPYMMAGAGFDSFIHLNMPMKWSLKMDYTKNKYILTSNNETPWMMKWQSNPVTYLLPRPLTADHFPILPNVQRIMSVDGTVVTPWAYTFGKETLGHTICVTGQSIQRTNQYVPFFPFNGVHMMKATFVPGPLPIEFQFQNVIIHQGQAASDEPMEERERPWSSGTEQYGMTVDPNMGFDNLDYKDVTIPDLEERFRNTTEILPHGTKYGFILRIAEPGRTPLRQMQFSSLFQYDPSHLRFIYNVMLRRSPIPTIETTPWQMETQMDLKYPDRDMEPSDLMDEHYQTEVQRQIKLLVQENGKMFDTLVDLKELTYDRISQQMQMVLQKRDFERKISGIVNHIMDKNTDPEASKLIEAVQNLRMISKEVKAIRQQASAPFKLMKQIPKLKTELDKVALIQQKLRQRLDLPEHQREIFESVLVYQSLLKQTKMMNQVEKIVENLQPVIQSKEKDMLKQKVLELKDGVKRLRVKQAGLLEKKHRVETIKAEQQLDQKQLDLHKSIQDLEVKVIDFIKTIRTDMVLTEVVMRRVLNIVELSKRLKIELYDIFSSKVKIDKLLRVKATEMALLHQLCLEDIKVLIHQTIAQPRNIANPLLTELVAQKKKLDEQSRSMLTPISLAIEFEQEREILGPVLPEDYSVSIKTLQKLSVLQWKALDRIKSKEVPREEALEEACTICTKVYKKVKEFVDQQLLREDKEHIMNPVVLKALRLIYRQYAIIDKMEQLLLAAVAVEPRDSNKYQSYTTLRKQFEEKKKDLLLLGKMIKKKIEMVSDEQPATKYEEPQLPADMKYSSLVELQQKVHRLQAKQLQQDIDAKKILIQESTPKQMLMRSPESIDYQQKVYAMLSKAHMLQNEILDTKAKLEKQVDSHPHDPAVKPVLKEMKRIVDKQVKVVKAVEDKLYERSLQDLNTMQPVVKVQELRDQMMRAADQLDILIEKQKTLAMVPPAQKPMKSPADLMKEIQSLITIMYGADNTEPRTIYVKMFGKKSLEQLVWEGKQIRPLEQDPLINNYLQEMVVKNDKTAPSYQKLKDELNTFRHFHVMCAYHKEFVPVPVREFFWRLHETTKHMYYDRSVFLMPNTLNIANNFEIITEVRRENVWMDMAVRTPYETNHFQAIYIPVPVQFVCPFYKHRSWRATLVQKTLNEKPYSMCEINDKRIKTRDGLVYQIPKQPQACSSVLAMDCSPNPKFVVTREPSPSSPQIKIIKLIMQQYKVELIPDEDSVIVKVNGQPMDISEKIPIKMQKDGIVLTIQKEYPKVMVMVPKYSLELITDGRDTSFGVKALMKARMCGLCGNFDGQHNNDLEGPKKIVFPEERSFASTYLIPSDTCDTTAIQAEHQVPQIRSKTEQPKPKLQTVIIQRREGSRDKICFSTTALKKCPGTSMPQQTNYRLVGFHCLDSDSPFTQSLLKASQHRVLDEMFHKTNNAYERVPEPLACTVA